MINKNKYHADEEPAVGIIKERFKEKKKESTLSIKKKKIRKQDLDHAIDQVLKSNFFLFLNSHLSSGLTDV